MRTFFLAALLVVAAAAAATVPASAGSIREALNQTLGPGTGQTQPAPPQPQPRQQRQQQQHSSIRYIRHTFYDPEAGGIAAWHCLAPDDWNVEGDVQWLGQSIMTPATAVICAKAPRDNVEATVLSDVTHTWTSSNVIAPVAGKMLNGFVEKPLPSLPDFLMEYFRAIRPTATNVRVVANQPDPTMRQAVHEYANRHLIPGVRAELQQFFESAGADLGTVVLEYNENGVAYVERIVGVLAWKVMNMRLSINSRTLTWGVGPMYFFRARKGTFDNYATEFDMFQRNARPDARWLLAVGAVSHALMQARTQALAGWAVVARKVEETSRSITDDMMAQYEKRSASMDRIADLRADHMRDRNRFYTPDGNVVSVNSRYSDAWLGPDGTVVASESRGFDPNRHSTMNFTRLTPVTP